MYWSDEVYQIFGLDPGKGPVGFHKYLALVHPHDRAFMEDTVRTMHEQRSGCDVTKRIVQPGGDVRYVRCVGVPVVEAGVFKGFYGTVMDVTEHELLTQELRQQQAYLEEAQRLTHTGSWASNLITRQTLHSSDENARLYGFDPNADPNPFDLHYSAILAEDEPPLREKLVRAIRLGADFDVEYRVQRHDGIRSLRAVGHHRGPGVGDYIGTTVDITDRKRAEEERDRLRQLETDLAHINRVNMMGELTAALAHEIKQPIAASITSANACLRWLAHSPPDLKRARAAATRVAQDGNRAADVIDRLRSFYKRDTPDRQLVDVRAVIREMSALLRREALSHSVTIRSALDAETPSVLADRVQLQQVFMNLMLNAMEAMKGTGGELLITAGLNSEHQLSVAISDTGIGFPSGDAERIFDAFHTTKPKGTGMGLAITRSIVESHGGRVWATSNAGSGATFNFTLPI
jgi:PAS domain S-box-containing protein